MKNKEVYYRTLIENDGKLNEIDLGESIGLSEDETYLIISQLLAENKIEYKSNRNSHYSIKKSIRRKI